jgi:hypothetical protein
MLDEIIAWHRWAAEGLLIIMLINLAVPYLLRRDALRSIFWTRVGYFAFWAFWSMVVFGGLIVWVFTLRHWPATVLVMVAVAVVLAFIDGRRAIRLRRFWADGQNGLAFNTRWVGIELILTLSMLLYGLYG